MKSLSSCFTISIFIALAFEVFVGAFDAELVASQDVTERGDVSFTF